MKPFVTLLLLLGMCAPLHAQSLLISTQNPDELTVCGSDTLRVTLFNTLGTPVTGLTLTIAMPSGIEYVPGSVQNAQEQNISVPNAPVLVVADLPGSGSATISIITKAACGLVEAINSGQLFSNQITVSYSGGTDQITSLAYPVETGLLVIVSVTPFTQSGEFGDILQREIRFRNTRLGRIGSMRFIDQHFPGFDAATPGAASQTNLSPVWFEAIFDGSFFSNFGDGDAWLEFNEEGVITETITITDCGIPTFDNPSLLRLGWGCDAAQCQYDSTEAYVTILPSSQNPDLEFVPIYEDPVSLCGDIPAQQQLMIINHGGVAAGNVTLDLFSQAQDQSGFESNSFAINDGSGWTPLTPNISQTTTLTGCNLPASWRNVLVIPGVPANDTVVVRFNAITCTEICYRQPPVYYMFTFYRKTCPDDQIVSDSIPFFPDSLALVIGARAVYEIGECLVEDVSYPLTFKVLSPSLLNDTGFLQLQLTLPAGIFWDDNCDNAIDGQAPILVETQNLPDGSSEVLLAYALPFSADSVIIPYCVRYVCQPDAMACVDPGGTFDPELGSTVTVYPNACERACGLLVEGVAAITQSPDAALGCGLTACDNFLLFVDNYCSEPSPGGGNGFELFNSILQVTYDAYRTNYGLQDDDDDRQPDSNLPPPDTGVLRLDRFMPGDSLRFDLRGVVISGSASSVRFQIFSECIESEMQDNGADYFQLGSGQVRFTDYDSLFFYGGRLAIKKANGEMSDCPISFLTRSRKHHITISEVNIEPVPIYDRLISMNHEFELKFADCSPDGEPLGIGDSIFFTADFVFLQNLVPLSAAIPALMNFRKTLWWGDYAWKLPPFYWPRIPGQYSGYFRERTQPQYAIRPCETSFQISPFQYSIRLARGNMFPYEVRPIARIFNYNYDIPPGIELLSAYSDLVLQENTPLVTDQQLAWTLNGTNHLIDQTPVFSEPVDEGFQFQTDLVFSPSCTFTGPDTAILEYSVQHPDGFPGPPVLTESRLNNTGFFDGLPILVPQADTIHSFPSPAVTIDFSVRNIRPSLAFNAWVHIQGLNGSLDDIVLQRLPGWQPVPGVSGLYQLGTVGILGNVPLHLTARNTNCAPLRVRIITGWDCDPVGSVSSPTCGRDTIDLELRLTNAVLELNPLAQPATIPLCAPSDWFVVEISNANDGNALNLTPSVKLPQGIGIVPGTTEIAYPAAGAWAPGPDPASLSGNVFQWQLNTLLPALAANGLPGFPSDPNNAFRIRFRVMAECGFVANAQPIYGVEGRQPCGISTNVLRKPDDPIGLDGVGLPYGVDISLAPVGNEPVYCGALLELAVTLQLQGTPSPGDSIYLLLPAGVGYEAGTYLPGTNAPSGPPAVQNGVLQLPLPGTLGAGNILQFRIKVRYNETAGCVDQFLIAQTRQQTSGFCATTGELCTVYLATGEALLQLPVQNPDLALTGFQSSAGNQGTIDFSATIANPGSVPAPQATLQIWLDLNGDNLPGPGDQLLQTLSYNQLLAPGASTVLSSNLDLPADQLCRVLAVLPATENCACAPKIYPLDDWQIDQGILAFCEVVPAGLGIDSTAGFSYSWQPAGFLSCNTCASTTFVPGPNVMPGDVFNFVLLEQAGACTIAHQFEVRYGETLGIDTPDQTICQGDTVTLTATPGGSYQWSGPGISQPGNAIQVLSPDASATYTVTVTLGDGCSATDMVSITVLANSSTDLGLIKTCPGVPVSIFGVPTIQPGAYTEVFPAANGCDSTVTVRLELYGTSGASEMFLCTGDSILLFDTLVYQAGVYCKSFTTPGGCDSTHCLTLLLAPEVILNSPDSVIIAAGDSVQLQGPAGFSSYLWGPAAGLSCTDCQNPWAKPDSSTTYTLTAGTAQGCTGEATYRLILFPPCDPQRLRIPNAITPDGDGINDRFRVVPFEGFETVASLRIYDRWGEEVYRNSGNAEWDATIDGKPAPMDVYVYIIEILCDGEMKKIVGDVTVLR